MKQIGNEKESKRSNVQFGSTHPNVQIETEHFILATHNRTEKRLLLRQSEKEKETRRERKGNRNERRRDG